MEIPKKQRQQVRLNQQCKADIAWWSLFIKDWNRIAFLVEPRHGPTVMSDASGSWGCGDFTADMLEWFQIQWPPTWELTNKAAKELLLLVTAAALWGELWKGTCIQFHSDNQVVLAAVYEISPGSAD